MRLVGFNAPSEWFLEGGERANVWISLVVSVWRGEWRVEGRVMRVDVIA
jgi:hypothetical protein